MRQITQHYLQVHATHQQKLQQLTALLRNDPYIRHCIQRIQCEVVPSSVHVVEKGRSVKKELLEVLSPRLVNFVQQAVEISYFCGFVPFVVQRCNGIPIPLILPLGSFTWSVVNTTKSTKKRKHEASSLYRYEVQPMHPELTADDVFVFNFNEPMLLPTQCLPSPVDHLCSLLAKIQRMELRIDDVLEWNSKKHVTCSERVDMPKDQTTDGISLLDDFRKYTLTGDHFGVNRQYMTLNGMRGNVLHNNASELNADWVRRRTFGKEEENDQARVHQLPPNTDINELANVDLKVKPEEMYRLFHDQVNLLFNMTEQKEIGHTAGSAQYATRGEIKHMRMLSSFCSKVAAYAYACCFDVNPDDVTVDLPLPSSMSIQSADDVKQLVESNILLPGDSLKIRKQLMQNV